MEWKFYGRSLILYTERIYRAVTENVNFYKKTNSIEPNRLGINSSAVLFVVHGNGWGLQGEGVGQTAEARGDFFDVV